MNSYWQPTPVKFRKIGDFCLLMIPVVQIGLMSAPGMSESLKYWIGFISSTALTGLKFLTNTKKIEPGT